MPLRPAIIATALLIIMTLPDAPARADAIDTLLGKAPGDFVCNSAGTLCAENLRSGTAFDIEASPISHSSGGRVAIIVQGGDRNFIKAAFAAAQALSREGIATRFVLQPDQNGDPTDARVRLYSNALPSTSVTIRHPRDAGEFNEITRIVREEAMIAYDRMRQEQAEGREIR